MVFQQTKYHTTVFPTSLFYHMHFLLSICDKIIMRVDPKIIPPILLCWLTMSKVDAGVMAVEFKHYSVTC